jgi:hypothetical protein
MPHHTTWHHNYNKFIESAKSAGVKHFVSFEVSLRMRILRKTNFPTSLIHFTPSLSQVKLSFYHALVCEAPQMKGFGTRTTDTDPFLKVPLIQMHRECDMKLIRLPITCNYSIRFASHFMSNATVYQADRIRDHLSFVGASGGKKINYISPNDVAKVAVRCLLAPKEHHRVGYTLTGPNAITDKEMAEKLSKMLQVNIEYKDLPVEDFAGTAEDTDWGPSLDVAYLEYVKASGVEEEANFASHDLHKVCGTDGETFDQYLQAQGLMTPRELSCFQPNTAANRTAVSF